MPGVLVLLDESENNRACLQWIFDKVALPEETVYIASVVNNVAFSGRSSNGFGIFNLSQ